LFEKKNFFQIKIPIDQFPLGRTEKVAPQSSVTPIQEPSFCVWPRGRQSLSSIMKSSVIIFTLLCVAFLAHASPRPAVGVGVLATLDMKEKTNVCKEIPIDACSSLESPFYCGAENNKCVRLFDAAARKKQAERCASRSDRSVCVQLGSCRWDDNSCKPRKWYSLFRTESDQANVMKSQTVR
jgi:hypothetical protein